MLVWSFSRTWTRLGWIKGCWSDIVTWLIRVGGRVKNSPDPSCHGLVSSMISTENCASDVVSSKKTIKDERERYLYTMQRKSHAQVTAYLNLLKIKKSPVGVAP